MTPHCARRASVARRAGTHGALAQAIVDREFDPSMLTSLDDDAARATLVGLKGIGAWSADIYLLMALRRADVWPHGDLALQIALREVKRMRSQPTAERITRVSAAWRPWRAVAARVLWHHYLSTRRPRLAQPVQEAAAEVAPR